AIALAASLLALGPTLRLNGDSTGVPLPYRLLADLPLIRLSRQPDRFDVLITLALAMMVAYGARALLQTANCRLQIADRSQSSCHLVILSSCQRLLTLRPFGELSAVLLTTLLAALLAIDYLVAPIITRRPAIPPFLASLPHTDPSSSSEQAGALL